MNIILIPEGIRKGRVASLSHRHLLLVLAALVGLPVFLGIMTYRIQALVERADGSSAWVRQEKALSAQQAAILEAKRHSEAHLNALARRLGELQAEMLRLNALGTRLTRLANLDAREFNFSEPPGLGGPERPVSVVSPAPNTLEALDKISRQLETQREKLNALESVMLDKQLTARVTPSGWPVDGGWVSSGFGLRADPFTGHQSYHEGVDIASRLGSPILAMGDGVITWSGEKPGYGTLVEVTHESGLVSRYAHTRANLVKVGDRVTKGQAIALVGTTGRSTGPHLHFEVVRNGVAVNPARYLNQPGATARLVSFKRSP
jgi:murein DD-endopeptidase MepM/ murein hydrolase activator NlpD